MYASIYLCLFGLSWYVSLLPMIQTLEFEAVPVELDGHWTGVRRVLSKQVIEDTESNYFNHPYDLFGVGKVQRCPFELLGMMEHNADPIQVTNKAVEALVGGGHIQDALACFKWSLKELKSGTIAAETPELLEAATESVRSNVKFAQSLLKPPTEMITKRIYHSISSKSQYVFPNSSLPFQAQKDRSIMVWDGALGDKQCSDLIKLFEQSELYQGNLLQNGKVIIDVNHKKVSEFDISGTAPNDEKWAAVDHLMLSVTTKHLFRYTAANPGLRFKSTPLSDGGFQMKRYNVNASEHHAYHVDSGHIPNCGPQRLIAVIIYLNTVDVGGETVFWDYGKVVKPHCGRVLMFPTTFHHSHAGRSPISNAKYNVVGFIME